MDANFINLFSSVLVMFFIFFIIVKWFLSSFERRILFIENLYNDIRSDMKVLNSELSALNASLRDFRNWLESVYDRDIDIEAK